MFLSQCLGNKEQFSSSKLTCTIQDDCASLPADGAGPSNQFTRRAALRAPSGDEESEEEFDVETER